MTASDFRAHLEALCWTQRGLAALLGVSPTIVNRWAIDHTDVPEPVATWLEGLAAYLAAHPAPRHRRSVSSWREGVSRHREAAEAAEEHDGDGDLVVVVSGDDGG